MNATRIQTTSRFAPILLLFDDEQHFHLVRNAKESCTSNKRFSQFSGLHLKEGNRDIPNKRAPVMRYYIHHSDLRVCAETCRLRRNTDTKLPHEHLQYTNANTLCARFLLLSCVLASEHYCYSRTHSSYQSFFLSRAT